MEEVPARCDFAVLAMAAASAITIDSVVVAVQEGASRVTVIVIYWNYYSMFRIVAAESLGRRGLHDSRW